MAKHLMVDMETLATTPNSVVLSLGAVHFDPYSNHIGDTLYFRINIDEQDSRHIDPDTIDWWSKQDPKIMEEAFSANDRIGFNDAINLFHKFAWGCDAFWSNGASFDLVIIEDMYRQIGFSALLAGISAGIELGILETNAIGGGIINGK